MKKILLPILLALPLVVFLLVMLKPWQTDPTRGKEPMILHVGGTMHEVFKELARRYEEQTGQAIELNRAGSAVLLQQIEGNREGDVYVCHDPFGDMLMTRTIDGKPMGVDEWIISELTPVIVTADGEAGKLGITGVADLARDEIGLGLTDYEKSTLGWMLPRIFERAGIDFKKLNEQKDIFTIRSGGDLANRVKMQTGGTDAGIVWNAVAHLRRDELDIVPIGDALPVPYVDTVTSATGKTYHFRPVNVTMATLSTAKLPDVAADFAKFVMSPENHKLFEEYGFTPRKPVKVYEDGRELDEPEPAGVRWRPRSQVKLTLYAGAGLRPALDELIPAFREETGIEIEPDYGGSGIVQARAQESAEADLFLPGDVGYVDALERREPGKVLERKTVSYFVPVIIKGRNLDKSIAGVEDFFREDVSVALGRKQVCQIGNVSEKILSNYGRKRSDLGDIQESMTVNELGNWVKMGSVDASIVWDAIAANIAQDVEVVEIPRDKNVISRVVVALLDSSQHPDQARRFMEFLGSPKARSILKSKGYRVDEPGQDS